MLAAQGVGAMLTMPVAGKLTDKTGAGSVVRVGLVLVIAGTVPFVFVDDGVPGWLLVIGLFLRGAGMGATLMPAMAAAYQALPPEAMARAASALEIVQRSGATLGIALLAVLLQHGLTTRVPGFHGTLSTVEDASPAVRAQLAEPLTAAAGAHVHLGARAHRRDADPGAADPGPAAGPTRAGRSAGSSVGPAPRGRRRPSRRPRSQATP